MKFLFLLFSVSFLLACNRDPKMKLKPLDLVSYGLPITIMAPDSAEILKKEYNIMRDITIRKDNWYFVQIFESVVTTPDPVEVKKSQLESIKKDKYFKEIIREDESGFIFRKQIDSTLIDYDFRYIRIIGDKEIIFQTGLIGTFTLEDVERMYKSVSTKQK